MLPALAPDLRPQAAWSPVRSAATTATASAATVAVVALLGVAVPSAGEAGPAMLVLAALIGLPHGAVDHLALGWADGRASAPRPALLAAYAAGAVLTAGVALAHPVPAVIALLVLSAAHFAEGEIAFDRLRGGPGLRLPAAALGCAVVAVPLLLRPDPVRPLLAALDPALPAVLARGRIPVLLLVVALVAVALVGALRRRAWVPAGELSLVAVAVVAAPPLLVFAAWFGAWHAPRHLLRLLALQPDGDLGQRLRRLARGAAAPTAAALLGLGLLALGGSGLPAAVLVLLLALTVPHAAVVARIGRSPARRAPTRS